jgi:hypothetical protein
MRRNRFRCDGILTRSKDLKDSGCIIQTLWCSPIELDDKSDAF